MPLDPSILLGLKQPEYQSPINALGNALALQGQMRQNQLGEMQIKEQQAASDERDALRNYLGSNPNLDSSEGQAGLYKVAPTQASGILKGRMDLKKTEGDIKKAEAETLTKNIEAQNKVADQFKNLWGQVTSPDQAAQLNAAAYSHPVLGPALSQFGTVDQANSRIPQDPQQFQQYLQRQVLGADEFIKRNTLTLDQRLTQLRQGEQLQETQRHNKQSEALTARGQNMTDARARDLNAITQAGNSVKNENELRKEFEGLPEVKSYKQAYPSYAGIVDAAKRSTPAADINIVYGLAKLYDPNSVVREGEYATVANSPNIPDRIKGYAQFLAGGGRLDENTKKQILTEAKSRIDTYGNEFEKAANSYSGIAVDRGLDLKKILQASGDFEAGGKRKATDTKPPQPAKTVVRTGTHNGKKVVQYSDGSIEYVN